MKRPSALIAALLTAAGLFAQPAPPPVAPPEPPPPVIELPPFNPAGVQKYDPNAVKARDLPYHVTLVKAPQAWAKNPLAKGRGVRIAVVDTGCQTDHPGFSGQVKGGYNAITKKAGLDQVADRHGHGTHCAGIVHSVVPEAEIYVVKALSDKGSGSVADLAHGIDYAVTTWKADVVSCSFGGPTKDAYLPPAIRRAADLGAVVICAAGNDGGGPGRDTEGYPGRYADSVSVAACDKSRNLASFSSWGPNVFTCDPGVDVTSLLPGTQEGEMSGTSMACPVAAAKCASWLNSNAVPKDKNRTDKFRLAVKGASPFQDRNNARGYGLYPLDKVTGEATAPPVKPTPGDPKLYIVNLAELQKQGFTGVRIDFGTSPNNAQPIPVMKVGSAGGGEPDAPPSPPVPVFTGPGAVFQGYAPPPVVYQPMPQWCPGGQCQPAPLLFPRLRGWR